MENLINKQQRQIELLIDRTEKLEIRMLNLMFVINIMLANQEILTARLLQLDKESVV